MAADILNYFIPIIVLGLIAGFFLLVLFSIKYSRSKKKGK